MCCYFFPTVIVEIFGGSDNTNKRHYSVDRRCYILGLCFSHDAQLLFPLFIAESFWSLSPAAIFIHPSFAFYDFVLPYFSFYLLQGYVKNRPPMKLTCHFPVPIYSGKLQQIKFDIWEILFTCERLLSGDYPYIFIFVFFLFAFIDD